MIKQFNVGLSQGQNDLNHTAHRAFSHTNGENMDNTNIYKADE